MVENPRCALSLYVNRYFHRYKETLRLYKWLVQRSNATNNDKDGTHDTHTKQSEITGALYSL